MRQKIISALVYPRLLVRDHLELDNCHHSGLYDVAARDCQLCESEPECQWLYDTDEFVLLGQKPLEKLVGALEFALGYVGAEIARLKHSSRRCDCDACNWLRHGQQLFVEINKPGVKQS